MRKQVLRILSAAAITAMLTLPSMVSAAEEKPPESPTTEAAPPSPVPLKPSNIKLETAGSFTSLQVGSTIYVYDDQGQIFQTKGDNQNGSLKDHFTLPYGPEQVPFILVKNSKNGLMVFSDIWPEFTKNNANKANDFVEAYDSGRVFYSPQTKIVSKTSHHYAEQSDKEVVVYTANDFTDLKKGHHESFRVEGKLRGLILYDCCPYVVVENSKNELAVYHAGEKGAVQVGTIDL
ncbi:hypothetical protein [Paenibacillus sedimenti]|uniref:Uncharacterized protein n=1 Tax=Paenibacillus sedimenti TaxID=2770274 RepID=A0A926QI72_9BACL|nr:hypothetical protein [Paenibacillus sedimenti]MBD0380200.1 hypothetical protein [Paenibacillus sedimenti]